MTLRTSLRSLLAAPLCGALAVALPAHGGQYRGPGEVVPPASGAGTSNTGGGTSGGGPGGSPGPTTGGAGGTSGAPASPGTSGGAAASPTPRGAPLDDDLTRWEFWWEFGKDPFLRLRDAVYGGGRMASDDAWLNPRLALRAREVQPPSTEDRALVAERLRALLRAETNRDTVSACLVALAKLGIDGDGWQLRAELLPFLATNDQEIRETAALSLGIAGAPDDRTVEVLTALVRDDAAGRRLSGGAAVNERTRAFAAFGLGLLLRGTPSPTHAHRIVSLLGDVLEHHADFGRELEVAAIEALSLLPGGWRGDAPAALRRGVVEALGRYYDLPLGPGEQLVQAHVPTAIGRLLGPGDALGAQWRDRFAADLGQGLDARRVRSDAKVNPHVAQSLALAVGSLSGPWRAGDDAGERVGALLLRVFEEHRDHQTRWFAVLALGRMGGDRSRATLLRLFGDGNRTLEQPWIAMALGVLQARERGRARAEHRTFEPDGEIGQLLVGALKKARNPSTRAALALALGLSGYAEAGDPLRALLRREAHQDDLAGYVSIGLGLLRDQLAVGEVRELMRAGARRPQVVLHSAQALGLLGDHRVVDDLCRELEAEDPSLVRLSAAASALGQIGDRRSIAPLLAMLERQDITPLTRAFAVVALGSVCDEAALPWNSAYATDCNYRASTSTLTDGAAGILDIL